MKKSEGISSYKLNRIAVEALKNTLRLHFDSIVLYENESYPSAFQLSILAIEEFSKANWIEHYVLQSKSNSGYPDDDFEQKWLKLLYSHPKKQSNFFSVEWYEYSPFFLEYVRQGKLEDMKQRATYVGLPKMKRKVDINARISTPNRIKSKDARRFISLVNQSLKDICISIEENGFCYDGIPEMDEVMNYSILSKLYRWKHKTGLKNKKWMSQHISRAVELHAKEVARL